MNAKLFSVTWIFVGLLAAGAHAKPTTGKLVEYKAGEVVLEGYLATPSLKKNKSMPAVLIIHDWMGLSDFTKAKADEMAQMGYVALAADIYGKGQRPQNQKEAAEFAGKYKGNIPLFRERLNAAYETLKSQSGVDSQKMVSFGYCFGGTAALELARSGAELAGAVSFHGGLATPHADDAKNIKGKVLVLHGAVDPWVPEKEVLAFQKEMNDAKVDYQFISYSGAVHAFTNPQAGSDPSNGAAYNAAADKRSWQAFLTFLKELK